jgi:hypothetical protein
MGLGAMVAAGVGAAASIGSGIMASNASKKASKVQVAASEKADASNERMLERQIGLQEPFRQGGLTAQNEIMQYLGIGGDKNAPGYGSLAKSFDELYGGDKFQQDPGAQFRQSESLKALERSAAARGNLLSGATMKGITRFSQDLASQEYQNAFNRYQVERSAKLNPLQSLMGSGQSATNVMTGNVGQAGQNEMSNAYNAGQARASGYIGSANALSNALGQVGSIATNYPMNKAIIGYYNRKPAGSGTGPGGTFEPSGGAGMQYNPFQTTDNNHAKSNDSPSVARRKNARSYGSNCKVRQHDEHGEATGSG